MSRFQPPAQFLAAHGRRPEPWTLAEARAYTRWLTHHQYENFSVVSVLLPKRLHQDFYNVYAYCRWADDLGDEMGDPALSLELLEWWRQELTATYAGEPRHPVFLALAESISRHDLPRAAFEDLISAFAQDQTVTRYETWDQVADYCVRSANPVGRLVLALGGYRDEERLRMSDATCTALQLANHWQDVRRDWLERERIYVPAEVLAAHGVSHEALVSDIGRGTASAGVQGAIRELCGRTEALFAEGRPLADTLERRLAIDVELFSLGGLEVLHLIRGQDFDTVGRRPRVSKWRRGRLLLATVLRRGLRRQATPLTAREAGA